MKKVMKKALSLMLALVMVFTLAPMTAFAAEDGSAENPYQLSPESQNFAVTVAPEETAYVQASAENGIVQVTMSTTADWFIQYGRLTQVYPEANGTATLTLEGYDTFSVYNSSETESVTVAMSFTASEAADTTGTMENPEEVTLETNPWSGALGAYVEKELAVGNAGYYYVCTAPADGKMIVSISAYDAEYNDMGWTYFVNNETAAKYGDTHWSDDEVVVYEESCDVKAGDKVVVFAATYDPNNMWVNPAGSVAVNFSFAGVGTQANPAEITAGSHATEIAEGSQGSYYSYTATEAGTVTITMTAESGWMYQVSNATAFQYGDTHWFDDDPVVAAETWTVAAGDVIDIMINTYDSANMWTAPAGTVNWTLEFTAGEASDDNTGDDTTGDDNTGDDNTGDDTTDETATYLESTVGLVVGDNALTVDPSYDYTVFVFEPTETGVYTISTSDSVFGVVGNFWVTESMLTADVVKETAVEWECTSVGQALYIAVKEDTDTANINIAREELVVKEEVPWTYYENTVTPNPFTFDGDADELYYIDFEEEDLDALQAVLGADGYYHLYDAEGPVLFVDLDDIQMSLVDAAGYGQLRDYTFDAEGNIIQRVDYNDALLAYFACADKESGLYPLTADLIAIYQNVGTYKGWYGEDGFLGVPEEDGWMFACYYDPELTELDPVDTPTDEPSDEPGDGEDSDVPVTGDNNNMGIWIVVLVLGVAAVAGSIIMKKKSGK